MEGENIVPFDQARYDHLRKAMEAQHIGCAGPRIVVLRDDSEKESAGGIIIPDQAQIKKRKGTVLRIGDGVGHVASEYQVTNLAVGDRVSFNAYDGVEHDIDTDLGELPVLVTHIRNVYLYWPREEG